MMRMLLMLRTRRSASQPLLLCLLAICVLTSVAPIPATGADELQQQIEDARTHRTALQGDIQEQQQRLTQLEIDEAEINRAIAATREELAGINADQDALRAEIRTANVALRKVEAEYSRLVDEIAHLDATLTLLESELGEREADLEARRRLLAQRIAAAYQASQTSLLERLLAAESLSDVFLTVDAHLAFGEQDAELADRIERDQAALERMRRITMQSRYQTDQLRLDARAREIDIRAQRARLGEARAELDALEGETQRLQAAQLAEFNRLAANEEEARRLLAEHEQAHDQLEDHLAGLIAEAQRRAEEERLRRLEEQRRREEAERQRQLEEQRRREEAERQRQLEEQRRRQEEQRRQNEQQPSGGETDRPPGGSGSPGGGAPGGGGGVPGGGSGIPGGTRGTGILIWPAAGVVTQEFGCTGFPWEPPSGDCAHFHRGIDIAAGAGTPIRAADDGVIVFVGFNPYDPPGDQAWMVTIAHGRGLTTWYAHLQATAPPGVAAGASVARGQVIGYMGNTGMSTGVHLHWEVHRNGVPVDPRGYV